MSTRTNQGEINITGTVLLRNTSSISPAILYSIRVSNPAAYTFTLSRYSAINATLIQIYTFTLDAGDVFTDDLTYYLNNGDYLIAYTNVVGTNYVITLYDANS